MKVEVLICLLVYQLSLLHRVVIVIGYRDGHEEAMAFYTEGEGEGKDGMCIG